MKTPKILIKPFKQTKKEKEMAKALQSFIEYQWSDFEPFWRDYVKDSMLDPNPRSHMWHVYWDKKGHLKKDVRNNGGQLK